MSAQRRRSRSRRRNQESYPNNVDNSSLLQPATGATGTPISRPKTPTTMNGMNGNHPNRSPVMHSSYTRRPGMDSPLTASSSSSTTIKDFSSMPQPKYYQTPPKNYRQAQMKKKNTHQHNHNGSNENFDFVAASDSKWAKHKASRSINNTSMESPSLIPRPPAGLIRTTSATKESSQEQQHLQRSLTPIQRNTSSLNSQIASIRNNHMNNNNNTPTHNGKLSTRAQSPLPSSTTTTIINRPTTSNTHTRKPSSSTTHTTSSSSLTKTQLQERREKIKLKKYYATKNYTFQTPTELVTYRTMDLSSRTSFQRPTLISQSDLEMAAQRRLVSGGVTSPKLSTSMRKISPSAQHLEILNMIRKLDSARQLCWSPSVSPEADPFYGWTEEDWNDGRISKNNNVGGDNGQKPTSPVNEMERDHLRKKLLERKRKRIAAARVGRYKQIDPVEYIQTTLPTHGPMLTNVKRRLPMRTDVGFPNATEKERKLKEIELNREAELEECSPRLIVMFSSDRIGEIIRSCCEQKESDTSTNTLDKQNYSELGLQDLPLAGDELLMASFRNKSFFSANEDGKAGISQSPSTNSQSGNSSKIHPTPNKASMFSPPLDATFSSTEIWRTRPFSDVPPGMSNLLAIPLDVRFSVGDIEPLVCTLALYCLPRDDTITTTTPTTSRTRIFRGKISEDFIFPAGDWRGLLEETAGKILARQFGMAENASDDYEGQMKRRRALFSYDPLALPTTIEGKGSESLHIVMQVHKVTHKHASNAYIYDHKSSFHTPNDKSGRFFGSNKSKHHSERSSGSTSVSTTLEQRSGETRAWKAYDAFGTQFLTPICYGVLPFFPVNNVSDESEIDRGIEWPNGQKQSMKLFSFPSKPLSEEEFIEDLTILSEYTCSQNQHDFDISTILTEPKSSYKGVEIQDFDSFASHDSEDSSTLGRWKPKRERVKSIKSKLNRRKKSQTTTDRYTRIQSILNNGMDAAAIFFTSSIGVDFTQTLLQKPDNLENVDITDRKGPRLLVDVSGDCAIMLNPESSDVATKKRSHLVRLPPSSTPCGYYDSFEIREVLYLPPNYHRHYDTSISSNPRTPTNLLYVYPRLIKDEEMNESRQHIFKKSCCSIRIRLVQQGLRINEHTGTMEAIYTPMDSIYNQSPGNESLLQAVYTKIPLCATVKHGNVDLSKGIPMRDEIKIRLPSILDGSHFLQFSLFSVKLIDNLNEDVSGGLEQNAVAETLIPLSSSKTKESPVARSATVIPNGLHRIKIGEFQFDVETRLASTIHINDPAVATVIRDFPSMDDSPKTYNNVVTFGNTIAKASEQAVVDHFYALMYLHLRILMKLAQQLDSNTFVLMVETVRSLFEIVKKVKSQFRCNDAASRKRLNHFLKGFIDTFDDAHFYPQEDSKNPNLPQSTDNYLVEGLVEQDIERLTENAIDDIEDFIFEGALSVAMKQIEASSNTSSNVQKKVSFYPALKNPVPFSRKAYGASKIDKMKAEAELHEKGQIVTTELIDDDETVITASTWQSQVPSRYMSGAHSIVTSPDRSRYSQASNKPLDTYSDYSSPPRDSTSNTIPARYNITPFEKARSMAKRMNTAAQLFIAPCVTPVVSTKPTSLTDASRNLDVASVMRKKHNLGNDNSIEHAHNTHNTKQVKETLPSQILEQASDTEEETNPVKKRGNCNAEFTPYPNAPVGALLRGHQFEHLIELEFSLPLKSSPSSRTPKKLEELPFLYEVILLLGRNVQNRNGPKDSSGSEENNSFFDTMEFLLPLCLKSFVLRCLRKRNTIEAVPSIVLDMKHLEIFNFLVDFIARSLLGLSTSETFYSNISDEESRILISRSDLILDFFVGLLSVVHPSQASWLITTYFQSIRGYEGTSTNDITSIGVWMSFQFRLRAVEKLSSSSRFVAINYPSKYSDWRQQGRAKPCSWVHQAFDKSDVENLNVERDGRLPQIHWLGELLLNECLSICMTSYNKVVASMQSYSKRSDDVKPSSLRQNVLSMTDISRYQSTCLHSISIAYELVIRTHATDTRFQTEDAGSRVAGIYLKSIVEKSIEGLASLEKMNPMHKVRVLWLLCVLYIFQEAPEVLKRSQMRLLCTPQSYVGENQVHSFIRVLKLCTSTFQTFVTREQVDFCLNTHKFSSWLVQESFNTVSAVAILLVDECCDILSHYPHEQSKMVEGILDLLLRIVSSPQSSVTLLRALGAVSHILEKIGATLFLSVIDDELQNWGRIIFSLMNSTSLSVRSMAVDLSVSLFGGIFKDGGNIDEVALHFVTILPEVVAREIALYSLNGQITTIECIESSLWPLRRAIADIEATDPFDDDRVDSELIPFIKNLCRACQAIIDGVLIEIRLQGHNCTILGSKVQVISDADKKRKGLRAFPLAWAFDADEESLFEAANFFLPETSPMQRLRWLLTLKVLHEFKGQWIEAAETLILCAKTLAEAIPHVNEIWSPSCFDFWTDPDSFPWLSTITSHLFGNNNTNHEVMRFAHSFLEPQSLLSIFEWSLNHDTPNLSTVCNALLKVSTEAITEFGKEDGMDSLAYIRLEQLLKIVMDYVDDHATLTFGNGHQRGTRLNRSKSVEESTILREMSASLNELVSKTAKEILLTVEDGKSSAKQKTTRKMDTEKALMYVQLRTCGKITQRFKESTSIPTFVDWDTPYVLRLPQEVISKAMLSDKVQNARKYSSDHRKIQQTIEHQICETFAEPYIAALRQELKDASIQFRFGPIDTKAIEISISNDIFIVVTPVYGRCSGGFEGLPSDFPLQSKKFIFKKHPTTPESMPTCYVEVSVANKFPFALSRQPILIATEFVSSNPQII